jgi:hypothetical protein
MPCTCGWCVSAEPCVQDQRRTNLRAEMLRVGGDSAQVLGGELEQQVVDHRLVVVGDGADRRRQGEHHMVVVQRQAGRPAGPRASGARRVPGTSGNVGCGRSCRRSDPRYPLLDDAESELNYRASGLVLRPLEDIRLVIDSSARKDESPSVSKQCSMERIRAIDIPCDGAIRRTERPEFPKAPFVRP